jgi:hypothetical protein
MKPSRAKALKEVKPVKKSVNKKPGSIPPEKVTGKTPAIHRKLTELLASSAAYGYWHGLFSHSNAEPYPELNADTATWREEIQAAIHRGFDEGRGRRTGEKNKPMEPPRIQQD